MLTRFFSPMKRASSLSFASARSYSQVVGFIGLGKMGAGMAENLHKRGVKVVAYDNSQASLAEAKALGIRTVDNLKTITQEAEVVVSMLPNDKIVTEVFEGQIFQNIKKGSLLIDCSTISPMAAEKLHNSAKKYNQNFVDAPVSGGVMAAKNAKLTFMVGTADAGIFAKCKEVLSLMGPNVFQCQKPGGGQVAKACNNMALAIEMLAVSEALSLGNKLGLDPKILSEVMKVSSSRCWSLEVYNPVPGIMPDVPASKNYEPGFASELMLKDLGIAKEAAQSVGAKTEFGFKAQQFYEQLVKEKGMGRKDFAIAYDVIHKSKQKRKKT